MHFSLPVRVFLRGIMYGKFCFVALMAVPLVLSVALPVRAETIQDAVRRAVENHPSVAAADASYEAAVQEKDIARSGYFPEVSVGAAGGRIYQNNATSRGLVTDRGAAYSGYGEGTMSLQQVLYDGMETRSRTEAARARMRSLEDALGGAREQIALRAAQAYLDVLRAQEAVTLIRAQREKIGEYEERIRMMFDSGAADEAELQQARDVAMIMEGALADYDGQLAAAQASYYEATGEMPGGSFLVPGTLASLVPDDPRQAVSTAKSGSYALKAAIEDASAAGLDVDAMRAAYYPDLTGELSYLKSDKDDLIGGEMVDSRALLRMNWRFSIGGRQISSVEQKKYEHAEAEATIEEIERQIERDVYQAYAEYDTALRKRGLSEKRVVLNEKLFAAYEAQFEGSRVSLLHLMRAESQLFNAKLEAIDNMFRYLTAQYAVLASMGYLRAALDASEIVQAEQGVTPDVPEPQD